MLIKYLNTNKDLILFTFFNLLDKAFVFLMPFFVLTFFKADNQYIQLEYIIAAVNIFATFADFGMNGYMFFLYQKSKDKIEAINHSKQVTDFVFLILVSLSILLALFHFYVYALNALIFYILIRLLFNYLTTFFTSYFRLIDKPIYAVYISIIVNISTLVVLASFFLLNVEFSLWFIFIPQSVLILFYSIKLALNYNRSSFSIKEFIGTLIESLKFSWPTIIQVFLMMWMANYGKINALEKLSNSEAVFLGYTLRFCMIIQLAHATLVGFYAKSILASEQRFVISKKILSLYFTILITASVFVILGLVLYQKLILKSDYSTEQFVLTILFALYTLLWCFYSYFEMYYAQINKNSFKLLLTVIIAVVFVLSLQFFKFNLLKNIAYAMFFSMLIGLISNILVLRKLKFTLT